jgi:hypothetical protein
MSISKSLESQRGRHTVLCQNATVCRPLARDFPL